MPKVNPDLIQWSIDSAKKPMKFVAIWREHGGPLISDLDAIWDKLGDTGYMWARTIYLIQQITSTLDLSNQLRDNACYNVPLLERMIYGGFVHSPAKDESEEDELFNVYKFLIIEPLTLVSLIWTARSMNYAIESVETLVEYIDLENYETNESLHHQVDIYLNYLYSLDALNFDDSDWLVQD
ncbi:MAG: hypothetical protein JW776_12120 [Candidatus Lokiarchaeota archaeon]|nr:hypothetical protein [Candidatus Lokiarchaeota archaeon]